jgi:hypothetical protein
VLIGPPVPPVHATAISPTCSARPSVCMIGNVAEGEHVCPKPEAARTVRPAISIAECEKPRRKRGGILPKVYSIA